MALKLKFKDKKQNDGYLQIRSINILKSYTNQGSVLTSVVGIEEKFFISIEWSVFDYKDRSKGLSKGKYNFSYDINSKINIVKYSYNKLKEVLSEELEDC